MRALSVPFTVITLGLFLIVVNALMLELASWLSRNILHAGIAIDTFGSAILGAIIISIVCAIANSVMGIDEA
jgi:putative membrane protein